MVDTHPDCMVVVSGRHAPRFSPLAMLTNSHLKPTFLLVLGQYTPKLYGCLVDLTPIQVLPLLSWVNVYPAPMLSAACQCKSTLYCCCGSTSITGLCWWLGVNFCLPVTFGVFFMDSVSCDFFCLVVTLFVPFPREGYQNPCVPITFFRPQIATNAVKYSMCSPLEASGLAFDEARSSSATHPSQLCSPQQPMETFARGKQGSFYAPFGA